LKGIIEDAYFSAHLIAADETNLNEDTFPEECPWSLKEIFPEALAKLALRAKFDDFDVGSIFRKLTYPIGHRRFAKNSNPMLKAQI
jgi:hypothetical protein